MLLLVQSFVDEVVTLMRRSDARELTGVSDAERQYPGSAVFFTFLKRARNDKHETNGTNETEIKKEKTPREIRSAV